MVIEVQLIYNVVLVSGVQQSESVIYICIYMNTFFKKMLSSTIGYYKILSIVPYAVW